MGQPLFLITEPFLVGCPDSATWRKGVKIVTDNFAIIYLAIIPLMA
jgi:hypothetical protein